jgi:hypothetical protein
MEYCQVGTQIQRASLLKDIGMEIRGASRLAHLHIYKIDPRRNLRKISGWMALKSEFS